MAVHNVSRRRLRSFLTVLGIIIGVAAVVSIISLGSSMGAEMSGQLEKFGGDILTIVPERIAAFSAESHEFEPDVTLGAKGALGELFTSSDLVKISKIEGVDKLYGSIMGDVSVEFNKEAVSLSVSGVSDLDAWKTIEAEKVGLKSGRYLSDDDTYSTVIGYSVAHEIFSTDIGVRKRITINGVEFRVVGILNEIGGFLRALDRSVYIPVDTAREIFAGEFAEDEFYSVSIKVAEGYTNDEVAKGINETLFNLRKEDENTKTFTVINPELFQETIQTMLGSITSFIGAIAAISLITGGIGITNIMYATVTERTREIGIMKAVGATNNSILSLIILESGTIGLMGGIIGVAIGVLFAYGLMWVVSSFMAASFAFSVIIYPEILILGCLCGFIVGIIAGYLPARRAAKLQPVEALRYE